VSGMRSGTAHSCSGTGSLSQFDMLMNGSGGLAAGSGFGASVFGALELDTDASFGSQSGAERRPGLRQ